MQAASNPVDKAKDVRNDTSAMKIMENPGIVDLTTSKTSDTNTNTGDKEHIVIMDNENEEETTNENDIHDEKTDAKRTKIIKRTRQKRTKKR